MWIADFYEYIYILFVGILSLNIFSKYRRKNDFQQHLRKETSGIEKYLLFILILFFGLRPVSFVFVDTMYYYEVIAIRTPEFYSFSWNVENVLFDNFLNLFACNRWSYTVFFLLVASVYFICAYLATKKLFPNDTLFAYLVFLGAFSTYSYGVNGIKAGAATSVFLLAIAYRDNIVKTIILALISWGIHHSMSFPIAVYVVVTFYNKPKYYFYFWAFCLIMAIFHVTTFQEIFKGYTYEKAAEYLATTGEDWKGKGGFRLDFVLYSAMPILIGWYATQKLKINDKKYNFLLCYYLLSNAIWLLCMYVNYNNRIAYLSWFVYPFVLIYPLLRCQWRKSRYHEVANYATWHLVFTSFMTVVYYGLSKLL